MATASGAASAAAAIAPSPAVLNVTQIPALRAAELLRRLFPNARIAAEPNANALIVIAPAPTVAAIRRVLGGIDVRNPSTRYAELYRLHALDAGSVGDLIKRSFPAIGVTLEKDVNALTIVATASEHRRVADAISQLDAPSGGSTGAGNGVFEIYTLRAALPGLNGNPSTSAADIASTVTQALASAAPDLRLTVSSTSPQLVITGSPASVRLARDLLEQLDVAQKLVVLDTQILEVDETVAKDLGLSFPQPVISSLFSEVVPQSDGFGGPKRLIRPQPITRTPLSLGVQLGLLIRNGTARVLADPRITTISGRTATIRAGDTLAIETTAGGGAGTIATTQIQTFQTGVTLDITPIVNAGNYVSVTLHPTVNSETGIFNGIPQISTRDTQTTVALQEDQTLIIGGLIQESSGRTTTKIPVLGDLPLVGRVFRETSVNNVRNELIITVTPHILAVGEAVPPRGTLSAPRALPTLPPGTRLPEARQPAAAPVPAIASVAAAVIPAPTPTPTGSPFPNLNTYTYGTIPHNNFAKPTDPVQIFYATLSPTVLSRSSVVVMNVLTTTNVQRVAVAYGSFSQLLTQVSPGQWQARFKIGASALPPPPANVSLTVTAGRSDGGSSSIVIPVSVAP
jgi:hypothetical protein